MFKTTYIVVISTVLVLSGCGLGGPSDSDSGIDDNSLEGMKPGIWIDGNGCDHWIIDDGIEGYMTPRFGKDGKPVCRAGVVPFSTVDFHRSIFGLDQH